MNPLDFPLLADGNINAEVVLFLRKQGRDVRSIADEELFGLSDAAVLRKAHADGRVVLTHDSDFGMLAVMQNEPFTGIIYLRPGHIEPEFTIQTLQAIDGKPVDVQPPFVVIAEQRERVVRIRTRRL